jgi:hypothetical protein
MTPENRRILIIETIRAIRIGAPVSKGGVTLLLEPWPDLYWEAMDREGTGWINLLQAAAARLERTLDDWCRPGHNTVGVCNGIQHIPFPGRRLITMAVTGYARLRQGKRPRSQISAGYPSFKEEGAVS